MSANEMRLFIFGSAIAALLAWQAPAEAQVPGRCETPASQRASEIGCYVSATVKLGELSAGDYYWHLYTFPDRQAAGAAQAAQAASETRLPVIEAHGKIWLYAIAARSWRPQGGTLMATLGPLQAHPGVAYTAHFIEAVFPPGMQTNVHFHHGSEVTYVVAGAECIETPAGKFVNKAGEGLVAPENTPMQLRNPGPEIRRAVALILHDAAHNWATPAPDWKPSGLCN